MHDKDLYATILGIQSPWSVTSVSLTPVKEAVTVEVGLAAGTSLKCPDCLQECPGYDHRRRRWRHLDTCQYQTFLEAEVPRVKCPEHGVRMTAVPWAEPGSHFTALFEKLAIDWLREASFAAVARRLGMTWSQVDGIQGRAVRRGLARRKKRVVSRIGVDETSFRRRWDFVTLVCDLENGEVLYVTDGHGRESLERYYRSLSDHEKESLEVIAMDMWRPFLLATKSQIPDWESKIAFDKFHILRHLNEAVNNVRKQEHRALLHQEDGRLRKTKYLWLQRPENLQGFQRQRFRELRDSNLKVSRAWAIKETAHQLWSYVHRGWAKKAWKRWLSWAFRSRLAPIRKVAKSVRDNLWGIINAIVHRATNAMTEGVNSKIQWIKRTACGFRNRERFRNAIYFHCGGLDLDPRPTHTIS